MPSSPRSAVISMRLPSENKARLGALAAQHRLSESGLLAKLVDEVLRSNHESIRDACVPTATGPNEAEGARDDRITLRLRRGDRTLAGARAGARGMKTASYLAMLVHNHVRAAPVLPPQELDEIRTSAAQLAALGRQLRLFDMPNTLPEPSASELRDLMARTRREVESAREAAAAVVRRNLISWEAGDA
ncbi:hypothetical protein QTH97_23895 [Variovorax sp. J22R24]|uniref:hypothetical protein n=1 Tax=Variovorax gracilis TaxID=3053502 RepID=UPI0025779129|nr:hypothetical protein [Variovorax sp. J22R24]MDM0108012.1 hypothetical protein [Variovorax sp. J22R24]